MSEKKGSTKKPAAKKVSNAKTDQLELYTDTPDGEFLTSNQGVRINDNQNTLRVGSRGPSLLEDHLMREKIMHFDHERIPERVVHARGVGAHGVFESNGKGAEFCKAGFLQKGVETPVFVRFSTVAGSKGSSDLARDVRGFATKFYTQEGVFDLVGNNIPVFFIQDAMKFPDFVHSVKPEPHNEIPQAASAHDTFWDFVSISTEATHMVLWAMSDRAIPRSLATMEGFGVHTFRLIDSKGKSRFCKFHWKPAAGVHSVLWDEAVKISGKDPDFHRRDLYDAIEAGLFPEWELGLQIIEGEDETAFGIDLLDPTKLVPEELAPVIRVGKLTLNRNTDNFFAETEQVAFCVSHIVPGIDFTNDPLMQGRLFSYPDTQLKRLGGPNFHELPINKSLAPVRNNQRDGHMRTTINPGQSSYQPNTTGGGCPFQAMMKDGGFASFAQELEGKKVRDRNESFFDHFSQATMFYNSQNDVEKQHIIEAFQFELAKVFNPVIRERMIGVLQRVDQSLADQVAEKLGIATPVKIKEPLNQLFPADVDPASYQPTEKKPKPAESKALSIIDNLVPGVKGRKVAILVGPGFDGETVRELSDALVKQGAMPKIIGTRAGDLPSGTKEPHPVDFALHTVGSVLFDAVFVPGGESSVAALKEDARAALFVSESYKHLKTIGASGEGIVFVSSALGKAGLPMSAERAKIMSVDNAVVVEGSGAKLAKAFIESASQHRCWTRLHAELIPV